MTGNRREKNLLFPTLLDRVTPEMKVAWIEPFAPVLPVLRVNGQAAATPGLGLDENFAPDRHETAAWVIFYKDRGENV